MAKLDLVSLAPDVVLILVLGFLIRALFGKMSSIEEQTHKNNMNIVLFKQETAGQLETLERDVSYIKGRMEEFEDEQ